MNAAVLTKACVSPVLAGLLALAGCVPGPLQVRQAVRLACQAPANTDLRAVRGGRVQMHVQQVSGGDSALPPLVEGYRSLGAKPIDPAVGRPKPEDAHHIISSIEDSPAGGWWWPILHTHVVERVVASDGEILDARQTVEPYSPWGPNLSVSPGQVRFWWDSRYPLGVQGSRREAIEAASGRAMAQRCLGE